jgi:predicted nucleic acid-binding protein
MQANYHERRGIRKLSPDCPLFIMTTSARMVEPVIQVKAVRDDPNDDHVVSCAIAAGAEAIITGDKHLLRMSSYEGIKMLRLGEFLRRGQGKG